MDIENSNCEKVREFGREARRKGASVNSNPFPESIMESIYFEEGYFEGDFSINPSKQIEIDNLLKEVVTIYESIE